MPDVDDARDGLRVALDGLSKAQHGTASAEHKVGQVQAHMLQVGLRGVAQRLATIREKLKQSHTQQAHLAGVLSGAAEEAAKVNEDTAPAEAVNTLAPASERASSANSGVRAAAEGLVRIKTEIAAALQGGQPDQLMSLVEQVRNQLLTVVKTIDAARTKLDQAAAAARKAGNL